MYAGRTPNGLMVGPMSAAWIRSIACPEAYSIAFNLERNVAFGARAIGIAISYLCRIIGRSVESVFQ